MCGIVGYTGKTAAVKEVLLKGLYKLEYRGYDSAGIAYINPKTKQIDTYKKQGKIAALDEAVKEVQTESYCGIGHTRWATHGKPSDQNAHPHSDGQGLFSVVHNGIIENYLQIKEKLSSKINYLSETDTEVIPNLLAANYDGDLLGTVQKTVKELKGSYALCILCRDFPDTVIAVKYESPMIIGICAGGDSVIASDITAVIGHTDQIYIPENGDIAVVRPDGVVFYNGGVEISRPLTKTLLKPESVSMGGYESYMYKEILEVPAAIGNTVDLYNGGGALKIFKKSYLKKIKSIRFVGCGTAYHAGIVGKLTIQKLTDIDAQCETASEFRYQNNSFPENALCVFISQSGETADTLGAVKAAKAAGAMTAAITNVPASGITRIVDFVLPTMAGPEIAVASTKAYSAQIAAVYALCLEIAAARQDSDAEFLRGAKEELSLMAEKAQKTLSVLPEISKLAKKYSHQKCVFFIGRGLDYAVAQEGSLKLKEISYIFSEAYPSGELKHGTLALIEKDTLVIALITQKNLLDKSLSALYEVKARGAGVLCLSSLPEIKNFGTAYDQLIELPKTKDLFSPLLSVIPMQLFAYFMTRERGFDPDKPRNLAKSVTVE